MPSGAVDHCPDYDYVHGVTLQAYRLTDGVTVRTDVVTTGGDLLATFRTTREGSSVSVEASGANGPWRLLLVGVAQVDRVEGGRLGEHPHGVLVEASAAQVIVRGVTYAGKSPLGQ